MTLRSPENLPAEAFECSDAAAVSYCGPVLDQSFHYACRRDERAWNWLHGRKAARQEMARTREFDTDAAIDAMAKQFWADGYEATGIADLVEATGVGRQSLYGAFGSKKDMLLLAVDSYLDKRVSLMIEPLRAGDLDAVEMAFRRFIVAYDKMPEQVRMGCMMVNTSADAIAAEAEIQERSASYRRRFREAFGEALTRARDQGDIEGPIEPRADLLTLVQTGLFIAARSGAEREELARLTSAAVDQIEAWRITPAT